MATCSADTYSQNFYRLVSLLIDTGSTVLRKLLMKYVLQQTTSLDNFLLKNQTKLHSLQTRNILYQTQIDLMFPYSGTSDVETFDITLLSCLLKNVCGKIPQQERQELENLQKFRNEVSGHADRAEIKSIDFHVLWNQISQTINNVAQLCGDPKFVQETKDDINNLWINPRLKPSSHFSELLFQWYKSDQNILQRIEKHRDELTYELLMTKRTTEAEFKKHRDKIETDLQDMKNTTSKQQSEIQNIKESTAKQHTQIQVLEDSTAKKQRVFTSELQSVKDLSLERHVELTSELQVVQERTTRQYNEVTSEIQTVKDVTKRQYAEVISEIQGLKDFKHNEVTSGIQKVKETATQQHAEVTSEIQDVKESITKRMTSELRELKKRVERHSKQSDRSMEKLQEISKAYILSNTKGTTVQTQQMVEVARKLVSDGCCVISGKPGEGKTTTAASILRERFDIERCLVLSFPQEWTVVNIKVVNVIFIDDIFGKFQLDEGRLAEWLSVLDKVSACTGTEQGEIKVIIATRANILKRCSSKVAGYKVFQNVVEFASDKLLENEKYQILHMCLKQNNKYLNISEIQQCITHYTCPIGFPICCHLFTTNESLFKLGREFFIHPFKLFKDLLLTFAEGTEIEKGSFAALVFLFYREGNLPVSELKDNNRVFCRDLRDISTSLGMSYAPKPSKIIRILGEMNGVYVTCTNASYYFVHNTISEVVGMLYGKANSVYILRTCSTGFLHQCITVENSISECGENEDRIVIPEHHYREFSERLIAEVVSKYEIIKTAAHPALRSEKFVQIFAQTIISKKCKKQLFATVDTETIGPKKTFLSSFIIRICLDKYENGAKLLSELLGCVSACNHLVPQLRWLCWKCNLLQTCLETCFACGEFNSDIVTVLLEHGAVPNTETLNNAVWEGKLDTCRALMKFGALPDQKTLHRAVVVDNMDILNVVMQHETKPKPTLKTVYRAVSECSFDVVRAVLDQSDVTDSHMLNIATTRGNLAICRAVLEHGAVPDENTLNYAIKTCVGIIGAVMEHGAIPDETTFNLAVETGKIDIIRAVMEHGAVPNETTLNYTVKTSKVDIVRELLEHGAVPTETTLFFAVDTCDVGIVQVVMEKGNVLNKRTLNYAVHQGKIDIVRAVLEHGAVSDETTLNLAVETGKVEIVRAVMEHGAVTDEKILNLAVKAGKVDIVRAVMEHGAVPDKTTLALAVKTSKVDIVRELMEHGAVPDETTLDHAVKTGVIDIVKAMVEHGAVPDDKTLDLAEKTGKCNIVSAVKGHEAFD